MALEGVKFKVDQAVTCADLKGLCLGSAFGGAPSFLRRKYTKDLMGVDMAVTGIPFEKAATNRPGTRFGTRAVCEASGLRPNRWPFDVLSEVAIAEYGDLAFDHGNVAGDIPTVVPDGDHYVTDPILQAYTAKHGPISLLQFYAHSDRWPDDGFGRVDHGTIVQKAIKSGIVDLASSVQVGTRITKSDSMGMSTIDAREVHENGPVACAAKIRGDLGDRPAYLKFYIDTPGTAYVPGTGTPVPGGLTLAQVALMLRGLAEINFVGGGIVEGSPPFDTTGATEIADAHVAAELLCLIDAKLRRSI